MIKKNAKDDIFELESFTTAGKVIKRINIVLI